MVPQAGTPPNPDDHESFADFVNRHLGSIRANAPGTLPNGDPMAPARQQAVFAPVSNDKSGTQTTHADQVSLQEPTPTPAPLPTTGFTGRLNFNPGAVGGFRSPNTILRDSPLSVRMPPGGLNPTGTNQRPGFRYIDTANLPADPSNTGLLEDQRHASDADVAFADFMARHYGTAGIGVNGITGGRAGSGPNPYFGGATGMLSTRPNLPALYDAASRARAGGATDAQLAGSALFDSRAANGQLMASQAFGGEAGGPRGVSDEGHTRFSEGQHRRMFDPEGGGLVALPERIMRDRGVHNTFAESMRLAGHPSGLLNYWDTGTGGWM